MTITRLIRSVFGLALLASWALPAGAQAANGDWRWYGGDQGSKKYSPLDQIDASNVGDLKVAWTWSSPDTELSKANPRLIPFIHEVTPIVVNGAMYVSTSFCQVAAINPTTGETLWVFDTKSYEAGRPTNLGFVHRGVSYWEDGDDKRLFLATGDAKLWAINATTGKPVDGFGDGGKVDLVANLRRKINTNAYAVTSPVMICRDTLIMGSSIFDGPVRKEMPPGDVQAFDVRTGKPKWTFYNPPLKDTPGYDTWKEGAADYTGNGNVWTVISADEELGLVYLPFGTPTNDWYGGHRKGQGLFGETLVAVKAETGELVWYFQTTHHGVWDYDLCAAPALFDVEIDGKMRKVAAQVTKQGFLFCFDRETGEPIWPIEERPVPQSTAEGEESWPTQPFPTKPAPYEIQGSLPKDLINLTDDLQADAQKILDTYNSGPVYTPPMEGKKTIYNPGWGGGGNWMGCAFDPDTGLLYVPSQVGPISIELVKPNPDISNFNYTGTNTPVSGPDGLPLFGPPFGKVTAIDMKTGDHAFVIPVGDGPINHPRLDGVDKEAMLKKLGLPRLGDATRHHPLLTKTLLITTSGSMGRSGASGPGGDAPNFRAFNKATGELIAEMELPGSPGGTPMTYMVDGKQYIAVALGGLRSPQQIVAVALP